MKRSTVKPEELLALWLEGGKIPPAENFRPTLNQPTITVQIGEIDGVSVHAYGVHDVFVGVTGSPLRQVTVCSWEWFLDREAALLKANFQLFQESDDAYKWLATPCTKNNTDRVEHREVTPPIGTSFQVFRVPVSQLFGFGWQLCLEHEVCSKLHGTLNQLHSELLSVPDFSDPKVVVPPVVEATFTTCPHCNQGVKHYGSLKMLDWNRMRSAWYLERSRAEEARTEVVAHVSQQREAIRRQEDKKTLRELTLPIWRVAHELSKSTRYQVFKGIIDPQIVARFENLYTDERRDDDLDAYGELEEATKVVEVAIKAEEAKIATEIKDNHLISRLGKILDTQLPNCPICYKSYERDEAWLTELLVLESARPKCECQKHSEMGKESQVIQEIHSLQFHLPREMCLTGIAHGRVEVCQVEVGGKAVIRFAAGKHNSPLILVDRLQLKSATGGSRLVNTWKITAERARAARIAGLERQVASGDLLKLTLRFDQRRGSWSERRCEDAVTVVYAVARERESGMTGEGVYYCSKLAEPKTAQKPDFRLVLVVPIQRVR